MFKYLQRFLPILFLLSICLSGCWDAREVNSLAIILALGVDPAGDYFEITVQNPITDSSTGNQGMQNPKSRFNITSEKGRTIFEAARNMSTRLSHRNFWPHTGVVVLNNQLSPNALSHVIDYFVRDAQRRRQVYFVLTDQAAKTILNTVPQIETYTSMAIEQLIENTVATGYGVNCTLNRFLNEIQTLSGTSMFNLITIQNIDSAKNPQPVLDLNGTGVIYQNELMGYLNRTETRAVNILQNRFNNGLLVIDLEGNGSDDVTLEISKSLTKATPRKLGDTYVMQVQVLVKCNFIEYTGKQDILTLSLTEVENLAAERLEAELQQVFHKATTEIKADYLLFGNKFQKIDPVLRRLSSPEWREIFLTAVTLETTVKVEINSAGIVMDNIF